MKRAFLLSIAAGAAIASLGVTAAAAGSISTSSLRSHLGTAHAEALLDSPGAAERVRGIERLGALGTPRAVARLVRSLTPGSAGVTPEERLTTVRAAALFTSERAVRTALTRVFGGHLTERTEKPAELDVLAEQTAALALARSGEREALGSLLRALSAGGRAGEAAVLALIAYPRPDLAELAERAPRTRELERSVGKILSGSRPPPGPAPQAAAQGPAPGALPQLPTSELVILAASDRPGARLARGALAARDDPALRPQLLARLRSEDLWTRVQVAFGLGYSRSPDATGILGDAYRFESDARVRRAIVRGLARRRPDAVRDRVLSLARSLDPDRSVRALAVAAGRRSARAQAGGGSRDPCGLRAHSPGCSRTAYR